MIDQLDLFAAPAPKPAMDYDALIASAQRLVPPDIRVDMCKHESVTEPTYWLFRDSRADQIGSVAFERDSDTPWRACRMSYGMPIAEKRFVTINEALMFAVS